MLIIGQKEDITTESIELVIKEREVCKNILVDEKTIKRFNEITGRKTSNYMNIDELKRLGKLIGKDMTKSIFLLIENKQGVILGNYSSKEKAKEVLKSIVQGYKNNKKVFEMPKNEQEEIVLI